MLTENEIFANLERAFQNADKSQTTNAPTISPKIPVKLAIDPITITMVTFNFFDNGPEKKVMWTNARYAMNLQIFDQTEPFTPSRDLLAYDFSVQLHTVEFFSRYLEARHPKQLDAYKAMIRDTYTMAQTYPDLLIGQPFSKQHGTSYAWGSILRTYTDDLGEFTAELLIDGTSFRDQGFTKPPARKNGKRQPDLISKYDPDSLWRTKSPRFARKTA